MHTKMNFLGQGFQKSEPDLQDRQRQRQTGPNALQSAFADVKY